MRIASIAAIVVSVLGVSGMFMAYFAYADNDSRNKQHQLQIQILKSCQHDQRVADCVLIVSDRIDHAG